MAACTALFLLIAAVAPVQAVKPKPAYTLAEIAAGLRKWRTRVETVQVLFESKSENFRKDRPPRESQACRYFGKWAWSESGKYRRYWWTITYGGRVSDSLMAHDGRFSFELSSPGGDPPKAPDRVLIRAYQGSRDLSDFSWFRTPYFCIAFHAGDGGVGFQWLDEHIDAGNVTLAGTEIVGGRNLPVLKLPVSYFKLDNNGNRVLTHGRPHRLTIDPDHGYLVKKHEYLVDSAERSGEIHVTEEFRRVPLPGAPDVWFPAKGYEEGLSNGELQYRSRWEVHSVKLNEKLDDSLFHPKIPPGTKIEDRTPDRAFTPKPSPPEPSRSERIQYWLAWLIGAAVAAACVWMVVRTWKQLRWRK